MLAEKSTRLPAAIAASDATNPGQSRRRDRLPPTVGTASRSRRRCRGIARTSAIESRPDALLAIPRAPARALRIFGGALLEEVGVLDAIEDFDQPRQRVRLDLAVAALGRGKTA